MTRSQKMAPDLKKVGLLALMCCVNGASASIFEPASPLNIVPGKLESEVFESTDSEILRRDLFNEKWNVNNGKDTVYGGPGCQKTECIPSNKITNTEILAHTKPAQNMVLFAN